jgi:hypothetical protein
MIVLDECGFIDNLDDIYKSIIVPATLHRPNCDRVGFASPQD